MASEGTTRTGDPIISVRILAISVSEASVCRNRIFSPLAVAGDRRYHGGVGGCHAAHRFHGLVHLHLLSPAGRQGGEGEKKGEDGGRGHANGFHDFFLIGPRKWRWARRAAVGLLVVGEAGTESATAASGQAAFASGASTFAGASGPPARRPPWRRSRSELLTTKRLETLIAPAASMGFNNRPRNG